MNLIKLGEAEREFAESLRSYEAKQAGLGVRISLSFARQSRAAVPIMQRRVENMRDQLDLAAD